MAHHKERAQAGVAIFKVGGHHTIEDALNNGCVSPRNAKSAAIEPGKSLKEIAAVSNVTI
jgi:hypothetical protein